MRPRHLLAVQRVSEFSVIPIPPDIPFEVAALVGCGVPTGWGRAVHAAGVRAGETVVVYRAGGVGSNAVQGAAARRRRAGRRGRPGGVQARDGDGLRRDAHLRLRQGGARFVVEATWGELADHAYHHGRRASHDEVIAGRCGAWGKAGQVTVTAVGNGWGGRKRPRHAHRLPAEDPGRDLRRLQPAHDVPRLLSLYRPGSSSSTSWYHPDLPLEEVNQGYQDMLDGKNIRGVIVYTDADR